ncbi:MAG: CvpA family protein [Acidiferrobacterales bacterium]
MNVFDLALLCVLFIFGAAGVFRGFVRTVFFLVNWLLASAVAWFFSTPVSAALQGTVEEPIVRMLIAFVAVFLVMFFIGMALGSLLHNLTESMPILMVSNRVLGGVAGVSVGVVILVVTFLLAGLTALPQNGWWRQSALAPYLESCAEFVSDFLPADIARHIRYS